MTSFLCTPPRVRKFLQVKRPLTDHKRELFPMSSPDSSDGGDQLAQSLSSSPSVYSPPLPSPSWSKTPPKISSPEMDKFLVHQVENKREYSKMLFSRNPDSPYKSSPRRSPRNLKKCSLNFNKIDIITMLESPGKEETLNCDQNMSADFITPKSTSNNCSNFEKSSKKSPVIKPTSFYGSSAALLAKNEANSVAGIKKIYRVPLNSKVKTKLFVDVKPKSDVKKKNQVSHDLTLRPKKRKEIFTGVGHSLKPAKVQKQKRALSESDQEKLSEKIEKSQVLMNKSKKQLNIRDRIYNALDFSRMPYSKQRSKQGYYYPVLKFTKPDRRDVEGDSASKRKIFKTTLKSPGRAYFGIESIGSPSMTKKRRLLNPDEDFLNTSQITNASDILDLIEDGKIIDEEDTKVKEGVDDLILQLDDELQQENDKSHEINSSFVGNKDCISEESVLNLSNLSIVDSYEDKNVQSLDILDSPCKENSETTPKQLFPLFEKRTKLIDLTNHSLEKKQCNSSGKKWHPISENQYQIDAGQKHFGAKECSTCGIVYQLGDPDDEMEHEKYHRDFKTFKHLGWHNEKVVGQYGLDRIILVTTDNKIWWKKVRGILKVIDEELGYTTEEDRVMSNLKVYLYITKNHIAGCLVSTQISHAYKMLISEEEIDICSEDSFPVKCGISRIWTHPIHRRQGIASRLVDTMRKSFFFSYCLSVDDFAFSAPTEDGKYFAKKYTNKSDYLIYTGW